MSFKFLSLLLDILLYVRTEMQHDATSRIHSNTNAILGRFARLQATNTTSFNQVHPCPIPMFGVLQSPANCDDMTGTEWKVEPSLIEITRIPTGKRSHRKQKRVSFISFLQPYLDICSQRAVALCTLRTYTATFVGCLIAKLVNETW